jgi:hypothetical protein
MGSPESIEPSKETKPSARDQINGTCVEALCSVQVASLLSLAAKEAAMSKTLGVILIALGLFGLAWGGFTYTTRETVVDIGPIHATRDKTHNVPLPPIAGAVALIGGVVLLVRAK